MEEAWWPIPCPLPGAAVAEIPCTAFGRRGVPVRLIVRWVPPSPGSQLALFAAYAYHAFIADRVGDTDGGARPPHHCHAQAALPFVSGAGGARAW
ncbi:MAG: hypothetical protein GXX83_04245 [Gaiellales bacterium]|nr:hypothetical protein [Gaiellales bacterium]